MDVDKRLLIQGEAALGDTTLDQRANSPALRIRRSCVVRRIVLDMTGFREGLLVEGPAAVRPLVDDCSIRCCP